MLNRRHLFAAAPAVALAGLSVPASAQSELAALGARWEAVVAERDRVGQQIDVAFDRFQGGMPKTPRLPFTDADALRSGRPVGGRCWDWREVRRIAREAKDWKQSPERFPTRIAWAERFERAVEKHDAAVAAWDAECGMSAAEHAWDAKDAELTKLERSILDTECRSLADAKVKARVALRNEENDFGREAGKAVAEFVLRMGAH